jgi:transcription initiation factor TFIIH subunit 2
LAGPLDDIHIHPDVQAQMDYEGELTVVIGRDAKNVRPEDALDYVLGYTCGNDFSARDYQAPATAPGSSLATPNHSTNSPLSVPASRRPR